MEGEETWTAAQTAATAAAESAESAGRIWAGALLSAEDTAPPQDPGAFWQEASHALVATNHANEGEPVNPVFTPGVACDCTLSDAVSAGSLSATRKEPPHVAAPRAASSCVDCDSGARPDAQKYESAPPGVDLLSVRVARRSREPSTCGDLPAEMGSTEQAVASDRVDRPAMDSQAHPQQEDISRNLKESVVPAAAPPEEVLAEVPCPTEGAVVAGIQSVTAAPFPAEGASADAPLLTGASGGLESGNMTTIEQGTMAAVGLASFAAALPTPTMTDDELESCKQQLQEMKACLDAVWSQKEAFRQANERLSRAVGRLQGQNVVVPRQPLTHSLESSPPKPVPTRGKGLQRTSRRLTPRHSSRQRFVPTVDSVADTSSNTALPACSARRSAALPIAASTVFPSSHASYCSLQKQERERSVGEHRALQRGADCGKKAVTKECHTSNLKEFHPTRQSARFLRLKSGSQTQRDSTNADADEVNITGSLGYPPAPIGCPPHVSVRGAPQFQQREFNAHLQKYKQGRSSVSQFQANTRRSLPPVPRLDLQGLLRPQQRAAVVSLARSNPCALGGRTIFTAPDQQALSGQGRRLSSSQRSSSGGRSLAGAETSRAPAHSGHVDYSDESEFLSARRDSVTTQDSLCIGKGIGSKKSVHRQINVCKTLSKDGGRSKPNSPEDGRNKRETVVQCSASPINSGVPPWRNREDHASGRTHIDAQWKAALDERISPNSWSSARAYRQRITRQGGLKLDGFLPLQTRLVCVAGGPWKSTLSMRSTVGGLGPREHASFSARPSLAETAMKTPRTCFLDDRIIRASHTLKTSLWRGRDSFLLPRCTPAQNSVSQAASSLKTQQAVNRNGEQLSADHSYRMSDDKVSGGLSVEEQLTLHVRHCMELLQCTDGRREEDLKTADVSRTSSRAAQPPAEMVVRKEGENLGGREKGAGSYSSPLSISSSAMASSGGHAVSEPEEDSTLQACVRKPRDGYWHVIYTCVIKVRDTDFFLDVRFAGAAAEGKKCETARLVASKEQAGVFKVCIRHLLRSTRDFFDSARVLWWQPLPVVCSDEWLPYDEVMGLRADSEIRALRAKYPALAAAAHEREKGKAETAQTARVESTRRTRNRDQDPGEKQCSLHGREVGKGQTLDSINSPLATGRTARLVARNVNQGLFQEKRSRNAEASSSCSSYFLQRRRGSTTERSSNRAMCANAAAGAKVRTFDRTHRGSVSSIAGDSISDGRSGSRPVTGDQADSTLTKKKASVSSNMCPPPPRHYSEWDAVGLVYVGSLCAEQPVAQFKRILGSSNSNLGEPGGWYLTCAKSKPRCMLLSPSSDMSFLLSEPLTRSSSCSSDRTSGSVNSTCSNFSASTCRSRDSEEPQGVVTQSSFESDRSSTSKITSGSPTTGQDKDSPRRTQDDLISVLSEASVTRSRRPPLASVTERRYAPYDKECGCNNNASAIKRKGSYCSHSNTNSSSSISSNSSCCSSRSVNRSGTGSRGIPATSVRRKQRPAVVQPETSEAAFDKTCQLSLSRKLGPQELFIVRRSDRENGCFPLYHYFSGRYLCAHATNGLVGMLSANATPAAATAARAVQREIKASRRLANEANSAEFGVLSQSSSLRECCSTRRPQRRGSNSFDEETASSSCGVSSKIEHCLPDDTLMKKKLECRRTVKAANRDMSHGLLLEKDVDQKGLTTARFQRWSRASLPPLTATIGDSCASAAFFPTSPFFLSRIAHQGNMPTSHERANTVPRSSDTGDVWTPNQVVQPGESNNVAEKHSFYAADSCDSAQCPPETLTQNLARSEQQTEAEWKNNRAPEDNVSHENARRVTMSVAQQGARKLGALAFTKRLKIQRKRPAEQSDTPTLTTSGEPSITPKFIGDRSIEAMRNHSSSADVALQGKASGVPRMSYRNTAPLAPSLFELVTVSDLLVQQTVARILAAVPQPTTLADDHQEVQCSSVDADYRVRDTESICRAAGEAEASTHFSGAQIVEKRERRSLALDRMEQLLVPETPPGTSTVEKERRYAKGHTLDGEEEICCSPEYLPQVDKDTAAAGERGGGEYIAASTSVQNVSASNRRSRRNSDSTARGGSLTRVKASSHCFTTYAASKRASLPARRSTVLPRDVPLLLPRAPVNLAASSPQRASMVQGSSVRSQRQKSTYDTQTHMLRRIQQQQPFGKHRQQPRRSHQPASERERVFSTALPRNYVKRESLRVVGGCEQFCLDDCDALTEIASDEIPTRRLES